MIDPAKLRRLLETAERYGSGVRVTIELQPKSTGKRAMMGLSLTYEGGRQELGWVDIESSNFDLALHRMEEVLATRFSPPDGVE